jgi:transcriptional regulator with XRE-family HTH domain
MAKKKAGKKAADKVNVERKRMQDQSRAVLGSLGRRVYELRAEHNMTQRDLQERSGVTQPFISEIERGLGNPTWERLSAICHAFGITFPDLVVQSLFRNIKVSDDTLRTAATVSRILQEVLESEDPLTSNDRTKTRDEARSRK